MTVSSPEHATAAIPFPVTHHRTVAIDGVNIFYRLAGPPEGAPVVLLLHGSPTSSHMFRNLIPYLADRYQAIAPDYPGYGQSDAPDRRTFAYSKARRGTRFQCSFRMVSIIQRLTKPIPLRWQSARRFLRRLLLGSPRHSADTPMCRHIRCRQCIGSIFDRHFTGGRRLHRFCPVDKAMKAFGAIVRPQSDFLRKGMASSAFL